MESHEKLEPPRPSIAIEVRAWMLAAVVLGANTLGVAWWAATLTAKVDSLRDLMIDNIGDYKELEQRVRSMEKDHAKMGLGVNGK